MNSTKTYLRYEILNSKNLLKTLFVRNSKPIPFFTGRHILADVARYDGYRRNCPTLPALIKCWQEVGCYSSQFESVMAVSAKLVFLTP